MSESHPGGAWKKTPERVVEAFEAAVPKAKGIQRRRMFGYPCAFLKGNLFCGTFQDRVMVRLGVEGKAKAIAQDGARPFEPMPGRPMKEYAEVPEADARDAAKLAAWLERAHSYAKTLPPKVGGK